MRKKREIQKVVRLILRKWRGGGRRCERERRVREKRKWGRKEDIGRGRRRRNSKCFVELSLKVPLQFLIFFLRSH